MWYLADLECDVELIAVRIHVQVFLQTLNPCVANVCSIEKGQEEKNEEHRDDMQVALSDQLLFQHWIDGRPLLGRFIRILLHLKGCFFLHFRDLKCNSLSQLWTASFNADCETIHEERSL